ncbi:MAG: RNA methyltransferase [Pseudomonadota bacterium]
MAGTDHAKEAHIDAGGPVIVLVEPQMGENIGAAARAMWNFGLRRMRLVAPRDGWPNPAAVAMASGAASLIDEAQVFESTAMATADCNLIYATTARPREMTKRVLTPEAAMAEASAMGGRTAIVFGPERAGLQNSDVALAQAIVSVPVNPAFASLNLAQSVLLMAYEWRRQHDPGAAERIEGEHTLPAAGASVDALCAHLVAELDAAGFFYPDHKRPVMTASLENLIRRAAFTEQDVRTLFGVIRALSGDPPRRG